MYRQFTKELIQLKEFRLHELFKSEDDRWVATLKPVELHNRCTGCDVKAHIHNRKSRTLRHQWIPGRRDLYVQIPVYRFRCPLCGITWSSNWEGIPQRGHVTEHFKATVTEYCFGKTIQEVANNLLEPYSNVERWFYEQASNLLPDIKETDSPEQLCLDEFAIRKGHCYAFALMDPTTGHIWQTSEGKSRKSIQDGLLHYPFRQPPKVVVTDLAPGIAETIIDVWPEVDIVADKFHVIQLLTRTIEQTRKLISKEDKHKKIRHQRRLLMTLPSKLKDNELEERDCLLEDQPKLQELYQALQDLRKMYEAKDFHEGDRYFKQWIQKYMYGMVPALQKVAKTLLQWKKPILNFLLMG